MSENKPSCCASKATSDPAAKEKSYSYTPITAVFGPTFLMAIAGHYAGLSMMPSAVCLNILGLFVAFTMCVLAILKLRDIGSFAKQFTRYDLLAQRWAGYGYAYPFLEAFVGIGMIAGGLFLSFVAPVALIIGGIGAVSVVKAVYIEKQSLACACVGGDSKVKVPLGFLSLSENLMMVGMALIMLIL